MKKSYKQEQDSGKRTGGGKGDEHSQESIPEELMLPLGPLKDM